MSTPGHGYCSGCDPRATPVLLVPLPVHVLVPVSVYRRRHVIRRTRLLRCRVHDEPGFCGAAYTCDILEGQYGCDCGGCYRDLFSSAAPARSASPTTSHAPTKAHSPVGSFSQLNQACDALEEGGTLNVEVTESFTFETVLLNPTYWHPSHIPLIPVRCLLSTAPPGSRPWSPRLPCDHRTHEPTYPLLRSHPRPSLPTAVVLVGTLVAVSAAARRLLGRRRRPGGEARRRRGMSNPIAPCNRPSISRKSPPPPPSQALGGNLASVAT